MKNAMHDQDREKAASIMQNLNVPPRNVIRSNPFLNHVPREELSIELMVEDLN